MFEGTHSLNGKISLFLSEFLNIVRVFVQVLAKLPFHVIHEKYEHYKTKVFTK